MILRVNLRSKKERLRTESKLCSCQGVKAPQAGRRKKRKIGRPENQNGGKADAKATLPGWELNKLTISGGNDEGVPPVPLPNTEVKPFSADGT